MSLHVRFSGAWRASAPYVRDAGAWKIAAAVYVRNGGVWRTVGTRLAWVDISGATSAPRGSDINLFATVSGGYGTITYAWSRLSGMGIVSGDSSSAGVTISPVSPTAGIGSYRCTASDSLTGDSVYFDVDVVWT